MTDPRPWRAGDVVRLNDGSVWARSGHRDTPWTALADDWDMRRFIDDSMIIGDPVLLVRDGQPVHADDVLECIADELEHRAEQVRGYGKQTMSAQQRWFSAADAVRELKSDPSVEADDDRD